MKRCPTCHKDYSDESLSFCIDDGTPLVKAEVPAYDSEATLVSPSPSTARVSAPTLVDRKDTADDWNAPPYRPPQPFVPPQPKRRAWPWVVGIVALLALTVVGLGIAAAIVIPQMMRADNNSNRGTLSTNEPGNRANSNANTNENSNSSINANVNSNTNANTNSNSNSDSNTKSLSTAPTDEELVLSQLTDIENEWSAANVNADKKALERILADDYVSKRADGSMQGKEDYLREIKRDPRVKHWNFDDLKLTLTGERATLKGRVALEIEGQDEEEVYDFTDKFVWRDGRWQAVSSDVSRVKSTS